jgi:hypothetical protein
MSKMSALSTATFISSRPNENKLSHGSGRRVAKSGGGTLAKVDVEQSELVPERAQRVERLAAAC